MSRLHDPERRIDEKLRGLLRSSSPDQKRELLEIHRAVLDDVASHVDTLPRGKLAFVYTQLNVRILLPDPSVQRSYELVFVEADALERDIRLRLEDQRVELPPNLPYGSNWCRSCHPMWRPAASMCIMEPLPLSSPLMK